MTHNVLEITARSGGVLDNTPLQQLTFGEPELFSIDRVLDHPIPTAIVSGQ